MAQRIEHLPGRPRVYPWHVWADGSNWLIVRGEDYLVPSTSMAALVREHARRTGRTATAYVDRERDAVAFRFDELKEAA